MAETVKISGELESLATGNKVVDVANVKDKTRGNKTQFQINADVEETIGADDVPGSIKGRIKENETALGEGGSVDQRIAEESAKHYLKSETYNKTELNSMITTPNQGYVTATATDQTTDVTDVLPATGSANTVYRVGNWDGSQFDETVYSEYAWKGNGYVHLSTKTQIGEVFDISAYHATGGTLAIYDNLAAALDSNNGGGIPQSLQKGGMRIQFIQTSDNNYVKFFCTADEFTTDVTKWQGVDEEPTAGSDNLVKSGGVKNGLNKLKQNTAGLIEAEADADFGICDKEGNVIVEFKGGNIRTKNFDSSDSQKTLKILFIGNSFTYDAVSCVKGLLSELMPNYNIVIGVVYNGGESLMGYDEGGMERTISQYSKLKDGEWSSPAISPLTLRNAVEDEDWDVISFQQASVDSVDYRSYQPYLSNLINKMYEENSKDCKIVFMLTTPRSGSDHGVANFTNQASAAKDVIEKTSVYSIIPAGTAIQNLRSISYFQNYGDDGDMMKESHLQTGIGMFVESLAIVEWIMRFMKQPTKTVYGSTFIPDELTDYYFTRGSIVGINERNVRLAQQAAILANNDFSVITDMNTQNDYFAYENFEKVFYPYSFYAATSIGDTISTPQFNLQFARSVKYPCSVGDTFTITGTGGSGGSRLWAFVDSSNHVLTIASAGEEADDSIVTAPSNAAYFIMNPLISHEYSLTKN